MAPPGATKAPSRGRLLESLVSPQNVAAKKAKAASPAENSGQGAFATSDIQDPMSRYSAGNAAMPCAEGTSTYRKMAAVAVSVKVVRNSMMP